MASQLSDIEIFNEKDRLFKGWVSVEVVDKQGEIIPIEEITKVMNVWMKRGAPLTDAHSNRVIGRGLNWEFKEKDGKKGILITGQIFDDYKLDDEIWADIKSGKRKGLSFGGRAFKREPLKDVKNIAGIPAKKLEDLEQYEVAVVENPANQLATIESINFLAKGDNNTNKDIEVTLLDGTKDIIKAEEVQKPFAGYKDFADCVRQNKDKENPEGYCATIMRRVEGKMDSNKIEAEEEKMQCPHCGSWNTDHTATHNICKDCGFTVTRKEGEKMEDIEELGISKDEWDNLSEVEKTTARQFAQALRRLRNQPNPWGYTGRYAKPKKPKTKKEETEMEKDIKKEPEPAPAPEAGGVRSELSEIKEMLQKLLSYFETELGKSSSKVGPITEKELPEVSETPGSTVKIPKPSGEEKKPEEDKIKLTGELITQIANEVKKELNIQKVSTERPVLVEKEDDKKDLAYKIAKGIKKFNPLEIARERMIEEQNAIKEVLGVN